ncbi:MAG: hypothetical protein ABL958_19855, partial [Bdellovibrionia bacterium]
MEFIGLGKVQFGSSVCRLQVQGDSVEPELFLTERATQVKADGAWPSKGIQHFMPAVANSDPKKIYISENRDAQDPMEFEKKLDDKYPFFEWIRKSGWDRFSRRFNSK